MSKPRVFVTRAILEPGLTMVKQFCEAEIWPDELPPSHAQIVAHVRGVQGLLSLLTDRIDAEVMEAAGSGLRVISNYAVGVDNVDLEAARQRGIPVGHTPGILTEATADLTFALLLAAARRVVEGDRLVKAGGWKTWGPGFMLGADLHGATLGIVGFGRIGRAVARRAGGFGMHIIFSDPNAASSEPGVKALQVDLDRLLSSADFISLHVPLTTETRELINAKTLSQMKAGAILINTSRGPVVDQAALYEALHTKHLAAAALDVTVPEPLPVESNLLKLENCIVVPHIASASYKTRQRMSRMAADNLIAGLKGEKMQHCANPEVYKE